MENRELIKIIRNDMLKKDITDFNIANIIPTDDPNQIKISGYYGEISVVFTLNKDTGEIISKEKGKHNAVQIVESHIPVTDSISVSGTLYFELYDKYFVGGKIIDASPIKLLIDKDDSKYLTGFEIYVSDFKENTIKDVNEMATRFVNYLSLFQNQPVRHKRPRIRKFLSDGKTQNSISFDVGAVLVKVFDLDLNKSMPLLMKDSKLNQKLAHAQEGIKALTDNDFAKAISEFWIVMEDENLAMPKNYTNLRHAVNHKQINGTDAIDDLRDNFRINMKKGDYLNINDPAIQNILEKEARDMHKLVCTYLNNELSSNSYV